MNISGILITILSFSVFCGFLNLFIAIIARKNTVDYLRKIQNALFFIFIKSNIPVGILSVSICTHDILRYSEEYAELLTSLVLIFISFIIEYIMQIIIFPPKVQKEIITEPNPVFSAIDLMNDLIKEKTNVYSIIHNNCTSLLDSINNSNNNIINTTGILNKYLYSEKQKNIEIKKSINACNKYFTQLAASTESAQKNLRMLNQKISSSSNSLINVENGEKMLKDVNVTFSSVFNDQSIDINNKIQRILDNLASIAYKCNNIPDYPKPYKDIIDLYSSKIENVFATLEKKQKQ